MYDYLASDKLHKLQYITVFTSYPQHYITLFYVITLLLPYFPYLTFLLYPNIPSLSSVTLHSVTLSYVITLLLPYFPYLTFLLCTPTYLL